MLIRHMAILISSALLLTDTSLSCAQDSFADSVVSYTAGTGITPSYTNSSAALGSPSLTATLTAPVYGNNNIVGVGLGGELTLAFNLPIINDPAGHASGMDFTIFGNQFFTLSGTNISGIYDHPGLTVWVSQDDTNFYQLVAPDGLSHGADDLYPTQGSGNTLLPVSSSLSLTNFKDQTLAQALALYNGSAGGASYSIAWAQDSLSNAVDLSSIYYVMIKGTSGYGYIDGISRVVSVPEPSAGAMFLVGLGGLLFYLSWRASPEKLKRIFPIT